MIIRVKAHDLHEARSHVRQMLQSLKVTSLEPTGKNLPKKDGFFIVECLVK